MSIISTNVTLSVTLDSGGYTTPLTITSSGTIAPIAYGATALYGNVAGAYVLNQGQIDGGTGGTGGAGGIGASLSDGGTLTNTGTITGGSGGGGGTGQGGAGGAGVYLHDSTLTNASSGTIAGGYGGAARYGGAGGGGVSLNGGALTNNGFIFGGDAANNGQTVGTGGSGVSLSSGTLTNGGTIAGGAGGSGATGEAGGNGVYLLAGTLINDGAIIAGAGGDGSTDGAGGIGAVLVDATATNASGGTITGGAAGGGGNVGGTGGIGVSLAQTVLTNASGGTITGGVGGSGGGADGAGGAGASLTNAMLANASGGTVTGGAGGSGNVKGGVGGAGLYLDNSGLTNDGMVAGGAGGSGGDFGGGGGIGVSLGNGKLMNASDGTIDGGAGMSGPFTGGAGGTGVSVDGGTLVNAGTINGGAGGTGEFGSGGNGYAVHFGGAGTLVVDPGAVFNGLVVAASGGGDVLDLAGSTPGTLTGLGTEFSNFATVGVNVGGTWTLTGANDLAPSATLINDGSLTLDNATLSGTTTLVNNGGIVLDPSTMTVGNLLGAGYVTIEAGSTLNVTGVIASTETIMFAGSGAYLHVYDPSGDRGAVTNLGVGETIDLAGVSSSSVSYGGGEVSFTDGSFPLAITNGDTLQITSSADGTALNVVACFAKGTGIATPTGSVAVEALREGDLVRTASGGVRPVCWIGFRTIDLTCHPAPAQAQPIRIAAGAFADGVPSRDLLLSPDHAVLLDGGLVPVKLLRNGVSIVRETTCRSVTYYHIELDAHDVLLAEGLAAESYLDTGNRAMFDNAGLPLLLHPRFENDQARREGLSCAPFVADSEQVRPLWQALAARAGVACDAADTAGDPGLYVIAGGRAIRRVDRVGGRSVFLLPARAGTVRLVSRSAVPHEHWPWIEDRRRLGVGVVRLTVRDGDRLETIPLDHPGLTAGWWDVERPNQQMQRWTSGDATIPLNNTGPVILEVDVAHVLANYPVEAPVLPVTMAA